ncbi:MAG: hypothetical protein AB7U79_07225 [Candidatus Izemoplasmatales bacterium]
MKKDTNKDINKFYSSKEFAQMFIFLTVLSILLLIFELSNVSRLAELTLFELITMNSLGVVGPLGLQIHLTIKGYTTIEFDETGIHVSLFKNYKKKFISWDENVQYKIMSTTEPWLFIANFDISKYSLNQLISKSLIRMHASKEVIQSYNRFAPNKIEYHYPNR